MEAKNESEKNIIRLGLVSLFNDLGSETISRMIPFYLASVLGAPMSIIGLIEGLADATATLLKPLFGTLSDRVHLRKPFVVLGYGLSSLARPLLAFAGAWPLVAVLRFSERLGKGIRTAPRDALIADSSHAGARGRHFGINRSLDTLGALLSVAGFGAWIWYRGDSALSAETWHVLALACGVPGVIALALVVGGVIEVGPRRGTAVAQKTASGLETSEKFTPTLKRYFMIVALFGLANSSDAFILLKAKELGYSLLETLGMIALLNLVSAMTAIPAAALSDRMGRRALIATGWVIYAVTYGLIGWGVLEGHPVWFASTLALYGLFYGFTEGVEKAWIADLAPVGARGRAYGIFGFILGAVALPASLFFGWTWDHFGSSVPFLGCAGIALLAAVLLWAGMPKIHGGDSTIRL
ncbi:MFS transporter [Bdellovibrionota bacterium FG-2]